MTWESLVALRYLGSRKKHHFISVITVISCAGVAIGVWALIVVLAVMAGFEGDLRTKILETYAHALVDKPRGNIEAYQPLVEELGQLPEVQGVSPYLRTEVMITSMTNLAGVTLKGVRRGPASVVNRLGKTLVEGDLEYLEKPSGIPRPSLGGSQPFSRPPRPASPRGRDAAPPSGGGEPEPASSPTGGATPPGDAGEPTEARVKTQPAAEDEAAAQPADAADEEASTRPEGEEGEESGKKAEAEAVMPALVLPAPQARRVLPGVLVGQELKKNLLVLVGDEVTILSPLGDLGPTGPIPRSRNFRVAGVFYTGMYEYDSKMVYVDLPEAQAFLGVGDEVSGIELRATDPSVTDELSEAAKRQIPPGLRVRDWKKLNANLFAALLLEKVAMFVILTLVTIVASFNIVASLVMVVLEKKREVAILKALGATDGSVMRVFITEGVLIGAVGTLLGVIAGVTTCLLVDRFGIPLDKGVYYIDRLPVELHALDVGLIGLSAVVISFLATIYPAWLAARLHPAEGLRHE